MTAMMLIMLLLIFQAQPALENGQAGEGPSLEELYSRAVASVEASRWNDAISDLNAILEADPSHLPSRFYLAVSLNGSGRPTEAIETYQDLLAEDGDVFEARMNLGALLFEQGRPDEAVMEFAEAMRLAPDDPTPALYRAQILGQTGRVDEAIPAYRIVLELADDGDPASAEAARRLGALYLARNDRARAMETLRAAADRGVEDPFVFVNLGDLDREAGEFDSARSNYERALELDRGNTDIALRLALVLGELDLPDEAIPLLERVGGAEPALADTYLAAGRFDEAIRVYGELTASAPDNPDYWYGLGLGYYRGGDFERAITAFRRTVSLDDTRYEAWGLLGSIYHQQEDWSNAATMLLKYLEAQPDHVPSIFLLATSLDNLGDYERALLQYNRFIELDDGSDDARFFQVRRRAESLERLLENN